MDSAVCEHCGKTEFTGIAETVIENDFPFLAERGHEFFLFTKCSSEDKVMYTAYAVEEEDDLFQQLECECKQLLGYFNVTTKTHAVYRISVVNKDSDNDVLDGVMEAPLSESSPEKEEVGDSLSLPLSSSPKNSPPSSSKVGDSDVHGGEAEAPLYESSPEYNKHLPGIPDDLQLLFPPASGEIFYGKPNYSARTQEAEAEAEAGDALSPTPNNSPTPSPNNSSLPSNPQPSPSPSPSPSPQKT